MEIALRKRNNRLEEDLELLQRADNGEPQAVHFCFFLALAESHGMKNRNPIDRDSCPFLSICAALFLIELLPSRTPLCFRLRLKDMQ